MVEAIPMLLVLPFYKLDASIFKKKAASVFLKIMWGLNMVLLLFFTWKPGYNAFGLYEYIYNYTKNNGETLIISNVNNPYDMDGATINFQRPENVKYMKGANIASIQKDAELAKDSHVLIAINNNAQADSFSKAFPNVPMLYKGWPAWMNYFKVHDKEAVNQVWYLYEWKTPSRQAVQSSSE
jgi:hypothetical protein